MKLLYMTSEKPLSPVEIDYNQRITAIYAERKDNSNLNVSSLSFRGESKVRF